MSDKLEITLGIFLDFLRERYVHWSEALPRAKPMMRAGKHLFKYEQLPRKHTRGTCSFSHLIAEAILAFLALYA